MPTERLSMRRIRDLLRLKFAQGVTDRVIAGSLGLSKGTVGNYLMRFNQAGLSWPLPCELDDDIARHENLLITGTTGLGKSWIACALGHKACRDGRPVLYQRAPRMFEALALARGDGRHERILKTIARMEVLIIDDWGLAVLTAPERRDLLEILEDRHGRASTIVTSQLPVEHWHEAIGDPTLADAILDRLVHNAHKLKLTGESMRKAAARNSSLDLTQQP